jgi:hypothetical protein
MKMTVFWQLRHVVFTDVSVVLAASDIKRTILVRLMEAANTSETSPDFYQIPRLYNIKDSHLQGC